MLHIVGCVLGALLLPAALHAQSASGNTDEPFLSRAAKLVDSTARKPVSAVAESSKALLSADVAKLSELYKSGASAFDPDALKTGHAVLADDKINQIIGPAGRFASLLKWVLKGIEWESLANQAYQAGATGSEEAFIGHINLLVRDMAQTAGSHFGGALGAKAGVALGAAGGPLAILTGIVGYYGGGWIGEQTGGAFYDQFLQDWVKNDIAPRLYQSLFPLQNAAVALSPTVTTGPPSAVSAVPSTTLSPPLAGQPRRGSVRSSLPPTEKLTLALIIDKSGSMREENKIEQAKQAALSLVRSLSLDDRLLIVAYDNDPMLLFPFGPAQDPHAAQSIQNLNPGGGTDIADGLASAFAEIKAKGASKVVALLMTDGKHNEEGHSVDDELRRYVESRIPVYTVAFGSDAETDMLRRIADASGGQLVTAARGSLAQAFFQIRGAAKMDTDLALIRDVIKPGERRTHVVTVPPGARDLNQSLAWTGSRLGLSILTPSGAIIDAMSAKHIQGVAFVEDLANNLITVLIRRPEPGIWRFVTRGLDVPKAGELYALSVSAACPIEARVLPLEGFYLPGQIARVGILVKGASGSKARCVVRLDRGRDWDVPVNDLGRCGDQRGGDGLFSCDIRLPRIRGLFPVCFLIQRGSETYPTWATLQIGRPEEITSAALAGWTDPLGQGASAVLWQILLGMGFLAATVVSVGVGLTVWRLRSFERSEH